MAWKCQMTIVLGEGEDAEIVSLERWSNDPQIGMDLCFAEVMQALSTLPRRHDKGAASIQLLGWADPVVDPDRGTDALRSQRMLDRARKVGLPTDGCAADREEPH